MIPQILSWLPFPFSATNRAILPVLWRDPDYVVTGGFECDYDADARWTAHTKRCGDDITQKLYSEFVTPNDFWDEKKFLVPPYQMKFQLSHFSIGTDCTLHAGGSQMEWRCVKANVSGGTLVLTTSSNERLKPLQQIDGLRDYEDAFTADISGANGMCDIGYEGTSNHLAWNCTGNDAQLALVQIWQRPWPDLLPLVKQWCESQWQDDYALQSICVNGQRDGYDLLQRSLPVPEAVGTRIKDYCGRSWENNFALQAVCVRSQLEGYERMNGRR